MKGEGRVQSHVLPRPWYSWVNITVSGWYKHREVVWVRVVHAIWLAKMCLNKKKLHQDFVWEISRIKYYLCTFSTACVELTLATQPAFSRFSWTQIISPRIYWFDSYLMILLCFQAMPDRSKTDSNHNTNIFSHGSCAGTHFVIITERRFGVVVVQTHP